MPELWLWWTGTWAGAVMGGLCGMSVGAWIGSEDSANVGSAPLDLLASAFVMAVVLGLPTGVLAGLVVGAVWGGVAVLVVACVPRATPAPVGTVLVVAVVLGLLFALCLQAQDDGLLIASVVGGFGVGPLALASFFVLSDRQQAARA